MLSTQSKIQSALLSVNRLPAWMTYCLSGLMVAVAAVTVYIPAMSARGTFLLLFFAIIQATFWFGLNQGILAFMAALPALNALILLPVWYSTPMDAAILNLGFCLMAAVTIAIISMQRRLSEKLWEIQHDLSHAQAVGQIGCWRLNRRTNELSWSYELYHMFGIPQGTALTYETFLACVHVDDRDYVDNMWQAALRGEPYDIEHRIVVAGELKWVRERAVLEFAKNGDLLGGFGTAQNITAFKHYELALSASRRRYTGIFESAMDAMISIDTEYRIVLFNPAAEKMFGSAAAEVIGTSINGFIPEHFRTVYAEYMQKAVLKADIPRKIRQLPAITCCRSNGEEFPVEASLSWFEIDGQKLLNIILRDVSQRLQAELALREQLKLQDQLTKVTASVPGMICSFRLQADGVASMPYASQAIESIYGFSPEAVAKDFSPVFSRIHADDIEQFYQTMAVSAETLQPWRATFRYQHPSKGEVWIEGHLVPLQERDGALLWHGYTQDVTERKLAETALRIQENQLRLIMDATPALISYLDVDLSYVRVNAAYENLFGISREQIVGEFAHRLLGEKAWAIVYPYLERALAGEWVHYDKIIHYKNSTPRWVHANYIPDKDCSGVVRGIVVHVVDIDDRKQAEQKITLLNQMLQHRIEEMQAIFNTAPIGLSIADDVTGQTIRRNPAGEQLLGLPPNCRLSLFSGEPPPFSVYMNDSKLAVDQLPMQRAMSGEIISNQILDIVHADGQKVIVLCNAAPLFDDNGAPRGAVGAFMDITALNQANEAVRKSEAFVREVLDSLPEHVVVLDDECTVIAVNETWENFALENSAASSNVSIGANYFDVCQHSAANGDQDAINAILGIEALLAGQLQHFVMEYPCSTASRELWFYMHAKRIEHGLKGIVITHTDITDLKNAEAALRESEARLALVMEEVRAGYWDWDLASRRLFLSPEWKQQLGYEEPELPNRWEEWECRLHPEDRDLVLKAIDNYISGLNKNYELQFRLCHKDGSYRWIHSRGGLLHDKHNRPYRMLGINLDITDYMSSRELNERRDKMERSFRFSLASQTVAAIAHELNQPLTAIASYAEVALKLQQSASPDSPTLKHVLEKCAQQAQRAGQVMRELLSQLQQTQTISEPVEINSAVKEALNLVKLDRDLSQFKIELQLSANLPPVLANTLHIQKVLVNLINNALEAMTEMEKKAKFMTITTRLADFDANYVQTTVSDSGTGLADPKQLKTIFQPFYSTKASGLGMGLAVSRTLIQSHGGKLWAENNSDAGLSIHFNLPVQK